MLPATTSRVAKHSSDAANRQIHDAMQQRIRFHTRHPEAIPGRIRELNREWDIERVLEANASSLVLVGTALAATKDRRFLAIPTLVGAFLLQHALQGWCPPIALFRRLGVRTATEIEFERHALNSVAAKHHGQRARR